MKSSTWDRIERAILILGWSLFWTYIALILGDLLTDARAVAVDEPAGRVSVALADGPYLLRVEGAALVLERDRLFGSDYE